ncbi:MAG: HEAT repeat domain-containing protein [bacterium]|nr:HEAT repeat domain-containing protein [bacterium]
MEKVKYTIEEEVKYWFLSLNRPDTRSIFAFVFTVGLFSGLTKERFKKVHRKVINRLKRRYNDLRDEDLEFLRKSTSSYITSKDPIDFISLSYLEGVREGFRELKEDFIIILPILRRLSKDKDAVIRRSAAYSLRFIEKKELKKKKVLPILKRLSKDKSLEVREVVAYCLRDMDIEIPNKVLPVLHRLSKDEDLEVRELVADSLRIILKENIDEVLPNLRFWTKDKDWNVREAVAYSLRDIGKEMPDEVLPILRDLANDETFFVRDVARDSLMRFKGVTR